MDTSFKSSTANVGPLLRRKPHLPDIKYGILSLCRLLRTSPQSLVPTPGWVAGGIWTQSLPISLECLITLDHSLLTMKIAPWHWFKAQLLGSFSILLSHLKCDFSFSFSRCSSYNLMIWYLVEQNLLPQYCIHVLLKIFSHAVRMQKNHFDLKLCPSHYCALSCL